ncbi:MAG: hypothetical protein R2856_09385 [Caldilineaceae bacterium]
MRGTAWRANRGIDGGAPFQWQRMTVSGLLRAAVRLGELPSDTGVSSRRSAAGAADRFLFSVSAAATGRCDP